MKEDEGTRARHGDPKQVEPQKEESIVGRIDYIDYAGKTYKTKEKDDEAITHDE